MLRQFNLTILIETIRHSLGCVKITQCIDGTITKAGLVDLWSSIHDYSQIIIHQELYLHILVIHVCGNIQSERNNFLYLHLISLEYYHAR